MATSHDKMLDGQEGKILLVLNTKKGESTLYFDGFPRSHSVNQVIEDKQSGTHKVVGIVTHETPFAYAAFG